MEAVSTFVPPPRIIAGPGASGRLVSLLAPLGSRMLVVTGGQSYAQSGAWNQFVTDCTAASLSLKHVGITGEPSPADIDAAVADHTGGSIDAVVAWGGGSALDAGKAIAAMLTVDGGVQRFLEGVGDGSRHPGTSLPMIAVPTTSGTGSEATKNAVLSSPGPSGFKKSLRHDNFVPHCAVLDPLLMLSTPRHITAACGMDALSQLLESFLSTKASAMTDALATAGLRFIGSSLEAACGEGAEDIEVRMRMAWAACWSGSTLANAGLGAVHGMAGPLGGRIAAPHGLACGVLLLPVMERSVELLREQPDMHAAALERCARAGALLSGHTPRNIHEGCDLFLETLQRMTATMELPRLGTYGLSVTAVKDIVAGSDNKNNPVPLSKADMHAILLSLR